MCDNCYYDIDEICATDLYVCSECENEAGVLISFRNIAKKYLLNKEDVKNIRHINRNHPLFLNEDIKNVCYKKYKDDKDMMKVINNKLNHEQQEKQIKYLENIQRISKKKLSQTLMKYNALY